MKRYITRALNGEEHLWIVFWLYNILGDILVWFVTGLAAMLAINVFHSLIGAVIIALVLLLPYNIWAIYSLWKCAFNAGWEGWGYLCRTYVGIFIVAWCARLALAL